MSSNPQSLLQLHHAVSGLLNQFLAGSIKRELDATTSFMVTTAGTAVDAGIHTLMLDRIVDMVRNKTAEGVALLETGINATFGDMWEPLVEMAATAARSAREGAEGALDKYVSTPLRGLLDLEWMVLKVEGIVYNMTDKLRTPLLEGERKLLDLIARAEGKLQNMTEDAISFFEGQVSPCSPPPPSQGCIRREGTSEAAPGGVRQAVGGGYQSGWGRLLPVTNAIEAGTWRQGTMAGRRLGALEGGGGYPPPPSNASLPPPPPVPTPPPLLCSQRTPLNTHTHTHTHTHKRLYVACPAPTRPVGPKDQTQAE